MKAFIRILFIFIIALLITAAAVFFNNIKNENGGHEASSGTSTGSLAGDIVINEVMSKNDGIYPDDKGNPSDWVEIYNTSGNNISLSDYSLSDDLKQPEKWPFPNVNIKAHGYMVIFLTGDSDSDIKNGIIHCSFKLSSKGENLFLLESGNTTDSVEIPALDANSSYGRVGGKWQVTSSPSPGFENSDSGISEFKESRKVNNPGILITEVMVKNRVTIKDGAGEYNDWVEVANTSGKDIDVSGYGLSDDTNKPLKWKFPKMVLKAGENRVIFCSGSETGDDPENELHADFKLSSSSSAITLSDERGRSLDSVLQVSEVPTDWSYERVYQNGNYTAEWQQTSQPSPGYINTPEGFAEYIKNNQTGLGDIVISEILSSNNMYPEKDAKNYDYVEIENRGKSAVNLKGYGLTDDASNPAKFLFPNVSIDPGKSIIVVASGLSSDQSKNMKDLSAPFKLSKLGEVVSLFDPDGKLLDKYMLGNTPQNISVGREEGKKDISYFETPTPGAANGKGSSGIAQEVQFSKLAGKYGSSIQLTLSSSDGADIYYTTDGGTPTKSSTKYTGAFTVDKTMSIRAKAFKDGYIDSGAATATYLIGTKHTLPVVSITTDYSGLFDSATGIYANSKKNSEVPASFELYDESGKRVFQQDIGLQMTGGLTLSLKQQKSLAIYARSKYGKSTMAYKFFGNRDYTEYKSLILRTAGREGGMVTKLNTYIALGLVDGKMNVLTQAARPCVVYIDGKYWGIYFLMEKRNKYMVAQHEGVTDKSAINAINLAKGSGGLVNNGSSQGYKDINNYIKSHDMSLKESYDWVAARLDTDSFMDFMINEIYIANNDTGNIQFYQVPPDGKWIQIYQDLDISFYSSSSIDMVGLRMNPSIFGSDIFNGLLKYKPWRNAFIERFAWALKTIYNTDRVIAAINDAAGLIRGEVAAENERWSSERPALDKWEAGISALKSFAKRRPADVVNELKKHFTLTQDQIKMLADAIK